MSEPTISKNYAASSLGALLGRNMFSCTWKQRQVPMKVLCLGMSRTGTLSLKLALERLGYGKSYHMAELITHPADIEVWERALKAKYDGGPKLTKADWDKILSEYQSGGDVPMNEFAEELLEAYPDCKVILTNKDPDAFWRSWSRAIATLQNAPLGRRIQHLLLDPFGTSSMTRRERVVRRIINKKFGGDPLDETKVKAGFEEHYARMRRLVPKERLLEYRIEDGWQPLCEFLGEQIPEDDFPRGNSVRDFDNIIETTDKMRSIMASVKVALLTAGFWTAWRWASAAGFTPLWFKDVLRHSGSMR